MRVPNAKLARNLKINLSVKEQQKFSFWNICWISLNITGSKVLGWRVIRKLQVLHWSRIKCRPYWKMMESKFYVDDTSGTPLFWIEVRDVSWQEYHFSGWSVYSLLKCSRLCVSLSYILKSLMSETLKQSLNVFSDWQKEKDW